MSSPDQWLENAIVFGVYKGGSGGGGITSKQVQESAFNYNLASGINDAFSVSLTPPVTVLTDGLLVTMSSGTLQNLTTSPTLQVNALPPVSIALWAGQIAPGDIEPNSCYLFIYNAALNIFQLINPSLTTADSFLVQSNSYNTIVDSGTPNAYVGALSVAPYFSKPVGFPVYMQIGAGNTNTGASTLTLNGITADIILNNGNPLAPGMLVAGQLAYLLYNGTDWVLINPAGMAFSTEVQKSTYNTGNDTGISTAYIVDDIFPTITSMTDGLIIKFKPANANTTTAPTLQINGLGDRVIYFAGMKPLLVNDIIPDVEAIVQYSADLDIFLLLNPQKSASMVYQAVIRTFTSSGTYTPTPGMKFCILECWGSGGGGGGTLTAANPGLAFGGGGGSGGYSRTFSTSASIGASQVVTIAAGGGGGGSGGGGSSGGSVSVGTLCVANGGSGGGGGGGLGGSGAGPGNGNVTGTGSQGMSGMIFVGSSLLFYPGAGASTSVGGGGQSRASTGPGLNATGFGSGGAGGASINGLGEAAGGSGAPGLVIITEFIAP